MEQGDQPHRGFLGSLRRLGETCLAAVHTRVQLFALEFQQEKHWLVATLLWSAAAIFFGATAVVLVTLTILVLCPPQARPWVLVGCSVLFLALAVWAFARLRRQVQSRAAFAASSVCEGPPATNPTPATISMIPHQRCTLTRSCSRERARNAITT